MSEDASLRAAAYGQGQIFQSERDIQITEHHHHGQQNTPAADGSPVSVRVPLSAPVRAQLRDREELREVLQAAVDSGGGVHVLHGFGGCGKTAVARWLFEESRASRETLWVDASTESQLRAGMLAVAADRGASPEEVRAAQEGRRAAADLVWQRLDASPEPWLLVLDNADDPRHLRDGWLRASARGTVVVTSRQADDPAWAGAQARMHRVDVLPAVEAAQLLHDLAPGDHQPEATRRLAERLGCHPLALTLAGGFLAQQLLESWTVEEYLERLGEDPVALLDRGAGLESGARDRLSRTWQLSLDALAQRGLPEAMAVLRLLACLGHAPVPVSLLAPSAVLAVGGVPGLAAESVEAGLRGLLSASLVDLIEVPAGAGGRPVRCVSAHGLLLETVATGVPQEERAGLYDAAAALVDRAVPAEDRTGDTRLVEPHLLALLHNDATSTGVREAARRVRDTHDSAGRWADALSFATGAVDATARQGNTGDADAVADLIALGKILHMSGGYAASESVLEEALRAAVQWSEDAPLLLADARLQTAKLHGKRGRYDDALRLSRQAREVRHRVLGPAHADTAEAISLETEVLIYQGEFVAAVRLTHQLMDLLPSLHGAGSEQAAAAALLNSSAAIRDALLAARTSPRGNDEVADVSWEQAWERGKEALSAFAAHFGDDHPRTCQARHNLALVSWQCDARQSAIAELRKVLRVRKAELGEEHPFTLHSAGDLALMIGLNGDTAEGTALARKAYAVALRTLGPSHVITQACKHALQPSEQVSLAQLNEQTPAPGSDSPPNVP